MKKLARSIILAVALAFVVAPGAQASFGFKDFSIEATNADGSPDLQAGSHPFALTATFHLNTVLNKESFEVPDEAVKDVHVNVPAGFAGQPNATPRCQTVDFTSINPETERTNCPNSTVVGTAGIVILQQSDQFKWYPLFNLDPPPGVAAKLGFIVLNVPATIEIGVNQKPPYNITNSAINIPQAASFYNSKIEVWGNPADSAHDPYRGSCLRLTVASDNDGQQESLGDCPTNAPEIPFLTLTRGCVGPNSFSYQGDSWESPGIWAAGEGVVPPFVGCGKLGFNPSISARPTTKAASSPTGLDFSLDVDDKGLTNPSYEAVANSDIKKTVVTLPEGFSVNPSVAEGLEVCSEAALERETPNSTPGAGCPQASKIGSVEVETPLLEENVNGSLYQAAPYDNPFHSLIALYVVIKNPKLGILIKQPLEVSSDPDTGQLTTTADDMPQLPFSHFRLHFREGARSPLASPPGCGTFNATAVLYPWSGEAPVTRTSAFEIISGSGNSPCPTKGLPPFHPELVAGTVNNAAGSFSPFIVRITRSDAEQEINHFSIKLPPGVAGKLVGIPYCSDRDIAGAEARTGPHGGAEELADPSCPAASQVGRTLAGSGVGSSLAFAPGKLYLAGPYHGAPVSLVSITAGVVGPFDIGTVVVRLALKVNPETGEVFLDSASSDPIPHIIKGVVLHLRDIRAYTDRPNFTFNPTSCEPTSTAATVLGSGLDFVSPADDNPFVSTSRFQAADCAALPFKPKLSLKLKGTTKRAGNPALHAHLSMKGMGAAGANEAGLAYARVALPRTLFLDNAHIDTICTRVQFKQGAVEGERCPSGSVIGTAKAVTPILGQPLEGPVFLRANPERELPDIAAALHGSQISVVAVGHTDSTKAGGLRNTFEVVPDAPIDSVDINLFGGKRGLLQSSRNLCSYKPTAKVEFKGHNGKTRTYRGLRIEATGCKSKKRRGHKVSRSRR